MSSAFRKLFADPVPIHFRGRRCDVAADVGRDWQDETRRDADLVQVLGYLAIEDVEAFFVVVNLVHLVDDHGDLGDPHHVQEITVAARLLADTFHRVDDE